MECGAMSTKRWWARLGRFWDGLFALSDGHFSRRRRRGKPAKKPNYQPEVEHLENRWMPT
jgi:hypothetical protein